MTLRKLVIPLLCVLLVFSFISAVADVARDGATDLAVARDRTRTLDDRLDALRAVGRSGDERHADPMLRMLRDAGEDRRVRAGVVVALTEMNRARPDILDAYEEVYRDRKTDENLRYAILLSLGTLKAAESQALLAEALSGGDDRIRFKAAQALGMIGSGEAVHLLLSRLDVEQDRMVRAEIVRAVGRSAGASAEGVLARVLGTDPQPLVRYNAALSLAALPSLGAEGMQALRAALHDSSPMVRRIAQEAAR